MFAELFTASTLHLFGHAIFGHFEAQTSVQRKIAKIVFNLGLTALVTAAFGYPWGFVFPVVFMGTGITFHLWWCARNHIHPLTAEPKERYYALRGWST